MEKYCGNCRMFKNESANGVGECVIVIGAVTCDHFCDNWQAKEDEPVDDDDIYIKPTFKSIKKVKIVLDDHINQPKHYTQGNIEVIDFIEDMPCCEANVIKYVARYKFKGKPLEDLKKAEFYLKRLIKKQEVTK
jgi:hypothetical protein